MDVSRAIRFSMVRLSLIGLSLVPSVAYAQPPVVSLPPPPPVEHIHLEEPGLIHGFFRAMHAHADPGSAEIVSVHQFACLIDHLDKSLFDRGKVVVKGPDVWGQNRLTQHRAEYEDQMKTQLKNFEIILSSYQRRADLAALTSATSVGAALTPQISNSENVSTTNVTQPSAPTIPSAVGLVGPNGLVANANTLIGTMSPLLMPSNLTSLALANKGAASNLGLEPVVLLDERSRFLNYLQQLRRINTGDDRSDMPGYSLYLVRMPVSILPGDETIEGKGAVVTVEAKHNLTPDLLATAFWNVVILDTAYSMMDAVTRGQYIPLGDDENCACEDDPPSSQITNVPVPCQEADDRTQTQGEQASKGSGREQFAGTYGNTNQNISGLIHGGQGSVPSTEVVELYGRINLNKLVCAVKQDQEAWYRHDPSVVSWLLSELGAAYGFMREQARLGNPLFQPDVFENIGSMALMRNYEALAFHRENWLQELAKQEMSKPSQSGSGLRIRPVEVLAYALMINAVMVDRQLKYDMQVMAQRKGCACGDPYMYTFHDLWPTPEAQAAFNAYVACKWPIHVFSLDPMVEEQNQLDLFSQRTELQLALAAAISTGQVDFQNATTYARRLEQDLAAVNLNRTAVGFGAGDTTFGWRFYPRIQTPPEPSTLGRIGGILAYNGTGPDYPLKHLRIEPGPRECYALLLVPNFVPSIRLTTVTNWFDLKTKHPDQELETTDMVRLGRKLQTARMAMTRLCDSGQYRPVDLEVLGDRLNQLEAMLPLQSHLVTLPFEGDLTGSEIFSSTNAGLGPRLLTWYGEPARPGGSVFLLGNGFNVRDMKIIVGGVTLKDDGTTTPTYEMISRNVVRIDIPKDVQAIRTPVIYSDPSVVCHGTGHCVDDKGRCVECGAENPQKVKDIECKQRSVIDVHVATSNGISNHLLVEVPPQPDCPQAPKTITTTVKTTTKTNADDNSTTTTTEYTTTPPGIVLPPGTYLPMGGNLPAGGTIIAPGAANFTGNPPAFLPGTVPNTPYPTNTKKDASGSASKSAPRKALNPSTPSTSTGENATGPEAAPSNTLNLQLEPPGLPSSIPPLPTTSREPRPSQPQRLDPQVIPASSEVAPTRRGFFAKPRPVPPADARPSPTTHHPAPRKSRFSRLFGGPH